MHSPAPAYSSAVPQFRLAKQEDASALADLARQTFIETYAEQNDAEQIRTHCDKNFGVAQQSKEIADPNYVVILAYHDEALVGFAQVVNNPAPAFYRSRECGCLISLLRQKRMAWKRHRTTAISRSRKSRKNFRCKSIVVRHVGTQCARFSLLSKSRLSTRGLDGLSVRRHHRA